MVFAALAFVTVLLHLAFILFVIFGGLAVAKRPRLLFVHLACAAWGAYVSLANRICPLTPLEKSFRRRAGQAGYDGGFLEHYMLAVIYPTGLTATTQQALGVFVILLNVAVYAWLYSNWRRYSRAPRPPRASPN
jgi:hypothetical protein